MTFKFSNFGQATLQADVTAGATSLDFGTSAVTKLPSLGVNEYVRLTLWDGVNEPEIVEASAISGAGVATVTRGQEGTTARAWTAGTRVRCALTADLMTQAFGAIKVPSKYGTSTFSGGLYTVTIDSITSFPQAGQIISFLAASASTGASTVRFTAGAGYTSTYDLLFNSAATAADDIKASQLVVAVFTGTAFEILSVANKLTPSSGAITAPAFIPNGTSIPAAGMYAPLANGVGLASGGVGRVFITSTGNVGIGTSTPTALLHLKAASVKQTIESTGGTVPTFQLTDGTNGWEMLLYPAGLTEYFKGVIIREVSNGSASIGTQASTDTGYMVYGAPTGASQYGQRNTTLLSGTTASLGTLAASTLKTLIACTQFVQSYVKDIVKGAGASITTAIGLYVENITAGTTNWGIYAEGPQHTVLGEIYTNVMGAGSKKLHSIPAFVATPTTTQSIPSGADTLLVYDIKQVDVNGNYNNSAGQYKFTAPVAGVYEFRCAVNIVTTVSNFYVVRIYKNGALAYQEGVLSAIASGSGLCTASVMLNLAASDYVQPYFYQDSGSAKLATALLWQGKLISRT